MALVDLALAAVAVLVLAALIAPYAIEERRWQRQKATSDLNVERRASTREAA
jgi:hypothetical protein